MEQKTENYLNADDKLCLAATKQAAKGTHMYISISSIAGFACNDEEDGYVLYWLFGGTDYNSAVSSGMSDVPQPTGKPSDYMDEAEVLLIKRMFHSDGLSVEDISYDNLLAVVKCFAKHRSLDGYVCRPGHYEHGLIAKAWEQFITDCFTD